MVPSTRATPSANGYEKRGRFQVWTTPAVEPAAPSSTRPADSGVPPPAPTRRRGRFTIVEERAPASPRPSERPKLDSTAGRSAEHTPFVPAPAHPAMVPAVKPTPPLPPMPAVKPLPPLLAMPAVKPLPAPLPPPTAPEVPKRTSPRSRDLHEDRLRTPSKHLDDFEVVRVYEQGRFHVKDLRLRSSVTEAKEESKPSPPSPQPAAPHAFKVGRFTVRVS